MYEVVHCSCTRSYCGYRPTDLQSRQQRYLTTGITDWWWNVPIDSDLTDIPPAPPARHQLASGQISREGLTHLVGPNSTQATWSHSATTLPWRAGGCWILSWRSQEPGCAGLVCLQPNINIVDHPIYCLEGNERY